MTTIDTLGFGDRSGNRIAAGSILSILPCRHFNEDEITTLPAASGEERLVLAAQSMMDALAATDRDEDPMTYKLIEAVLLHLGRRLAETMLQNADAAA